MRIDKVAADFDADYATRQLQRSRNPLRHLVKRFYLDNILREVRGPTIDFGCGAGQLLARLPAGSVGVEINPVLLADLKSRGFDARHYDAIGDDFRLTPFEPYRYSTLVMSHVLEHFDQAAKVLDRLLCASRRLGIQRVLIVVPGRKGYASDPTHRTFVSPAYLKGCGLTQCRGFTLSQSRFFPFNLEMMGNYFIYNEYLAIFERRL